MTDARHPGEATPGVPPGVPPGRGLLLVDRSSRLRMTFAGDGAKATLGGLLSNDVVALGTGRGLRAVALTPKGRVIALVRVLDRGHDLLVDTEAAAADGFVAMIRKFVNPRLATYAVVTGSTSCLGVYGDDAAGAVAGALAGALAGARAPAPGDLQTLRTALSALAPECGTTVGEGDATVLVVRSTDLEPAGLDLIGAPARIATLRAGLSASGIAEATPEQLLAARIDAGIPAFGVEMDAETLPQEANLDALGAISFEKGCYTGQEVVARIHFRGHVNRQLRRLVSPEPLPVGARVLDAAGRDVGDVRSSVRSAAHGPIAVAMVRREVEPGSTVRVTVGAQEWSARVEPLEMTDARPGRAARP